MFARAELESALEHYQATVRRAYDGQDWALFAGLFTEDADYNEHAYGRFSGRPAIADWAVRTMTGFPGNAMVGCYEEDVYNPMRFMEMVAGWAAVADAHGTLPDDGRAWLQRFAPAVR